jgi:hypothetical protein
MFKNIIKNKYQKPKHNLYFFIWKFLIILLSLLSLKLNKKNDYNKKMVCICTIGKMENLYAREYIEYYQKLGVDKIYIFDNNEINGESFETSIFDYIKIKYVKIINYRGYVKPQLETLNICYKMNYLKYEWIIFNDMDEFLYLKNYSSIKKFLSESRFNKCKKIYLNFIFYTDSNDVYYKNESLINRFKEKCHIKTYKKGQYIGKSIIRGNISGIIITSLHYLTTKIEACNGFGKIQNKFRIDSENFYFKHFSFKSTEEYCNKLNRGNAYFNNTYHIRLRKIHTYFNCNNITMQKINLLENKTGINLDYFRKRLSNYKNK